MIEIRMNKKLFVVILGILAASLVFEFSVIMPFSAIRRQAVERIFILEKELRDQLAIKLKTSQITEAFNKKQPIFYLNGDEEEILSGFIKKIKDASVESGITLVETGSFVPVSKANGLYKYAQIKLSVEGSQKDLLKFLYILENSGAPFSVEEVTMQAKDSKNDSLSAGLKVAAIYFLKK
jgi:hypothetical protein